MLAENERFDYSEKGLQLRDILVSVEEDRAMGRFGCTIEDLEYFLDEVLDKE